MVRLAGDTVKVVGAWHHKWLAIIGELMAFGMNDAEKQLMPESIAPLNNECAESEFPHHLFAMPMSSFDSLSTCRRT
jgi:hypothetical protein